MYSTCQVSGTEGSAENISHESAYAVDYSGQAHTDGHGQKPEESKAKRICGRRHTPTDADITLATDAHRQTQTKARRICGRRLTPTDADIVAERPARPRGVVRYAKPGGCGGGAVTLGERSLLFT